MLEDQPDLIAKFVARIDRLEIRYKGVKFADMWLVPAEELKAVRDAVRPVREEYEDLPLFK